MVSGSSVAGFRIETKSISQEVTYSRDVRDDKILEKTLREQSAEVARQLRGQAGDNQIANAKIGMAQNLGGSGATAVTHVLRTDS